VPDRGCRRRSGRASTALRRPRTDSGRVVGSPGGLPGLGWGAVAMQDLGFTSVPRCSGPIGVKDDGPAHSVDHDLMVIPAEQNALLDAGFVNIPAGCSVNLSLIS